MPAIGMCNLTWDLRVNLMLRMLRVISESLVIFTARFLVLGRYIIRRYRFMVPEERGSFCIACR